MNEFWSMILALKAQGASTATIDAAVAAWLEEHPDATTTVADGSITWAKLASALKTSLGAAEKASRVSSLTDTPLASGEIVESVGIPVYLSADDLSDYSAYGLTDAGWYVIARITKQSGTVGQDAAVTGAAGYIATYGEDHVDVAVKFEVAAQSRAVTVTWTDGDAETFVFKASDLAVRNLDYRSTFYVYDAAPYATWSYALTTDTAFVADKNYYTEEDGVYTLAEVTAGDAVPENTYYNHSKLTFENVPRNVTYRLDAVVDCPSEFILPEIDDNDHGAWFEIQLRHNGSYSMTLVPPEGVKVATEHTQAESAGMNMIDLHYMNVDGVKLWRFMNTHATIPA